jgi:hypothetical protein
MKKTTMKTTFLILIFIFSHYISFGQYTPTGHFENALQSKIAVLIVLAIASINNYIKWRNENNRTEP